MPSRHHAPSSPPHAPSSPSAGNSTDGLVKAYKTIGKKKRQVDFVVSHVSLRDVVPCSNLAYRLLNSVARWFPRRYGPFIDISSVIYAGIGEGDEDSDELVSTYQDIITTYPKISHYIEKLRGDEDAFTAMVETLVSEVSKGRTADTHIVRHNISKWLPLDYRNNPINPTIESSSKDEHGWNHLATAKALTPLSHLEDFTADPRKFCDLVQNGSITIGAHEFPSFLYPDGATYDADNEEVDLFRGHVLIRVLRAIYTGKASALSGYCSAARDSQSELHGMKELFPHAVAYAAVQAHFAISNEKWSDIDRSDFDYHLFFLNCAALLEDAEDEWVVETLEFLNSQMPALHRRERRQSARASHKNQGFDSTSAIIQRRMEKRARKMHGTAGGLGDAEEGPDNEEEIGHGDLDLEAENHEFSFEPYSIDPSLFTQVPYSPSPAPTPAPLKRTRLVEESVPYHDNDPPSGSQRHSSSSEQEVHVRARPQVVHTYQSTQHGLHRTDASTSSQPVASQPKVRKTARAPILTHKVLEARMTKKARH